VHPRCSAKQVLIAAWCGLRRGEIAGLRVSDVDLTEHTITVRKNRVEPLHDRGKAHDKDPKTKAGKRTVAIPPHVIPIVRLHLDEYAGRERPFVSRDGSPLRGNTLNQAFVRARKKVGLDMLTVHDLRHTGQTLAAQAGATMADLMKAARALVDGGGTPVPACRRRPGPRDRQGAVRTCRPR
jgi:integrase